MQQIILQPSVKDLHVNDLVAISRVRGRGCDDSFFDSMTADGSCSHVSTDHYCWRMSACKEKTILKATPKALDMLETSGLSYPIIMTNSRLRALELREGLHNSGGSYANCEETCLRS